MNHVVLIGRIIKDLELRTSVNNKPFVYFTLAVNDPMRKEHTDFVSCVAWNKTAENMARFVGRGSLISVAGKLAVRSVKRDNQDQNITEVVANEVTFLDNRKKDTADNNNSSSFKKTNNSNKTVNIDEAFDNITDYDTEISFINNKTVKNANNNDDNDDEAIIWDN